MIIFENVTKEYKKTSKEIVAPIKNLNLTIKQKEFTLLRGRSGSGKSTLLSLIAGISKPTSGDIEVFGQKICKLSDIFLSKYRQETIGIIFQNFNLLEDLSVFDNILAPLIPKLKLHSNAQEVIDEKLKLFSILDKKNERVKKLSGGEKQRVAIVRALINEPEILLCDEPTANLDYALTQELIKLLDMIKKAGKTIILASHDDAFLKTDLIDKTIDTKTLAC